MADAQSSTSGQNVFATSNEGSVERVIGKVK